MSHNSTALAREVPQWKKDLIARLRNQQHLFQHQHDARQQRSNSAGHGSCPFLPLTASSSLAAGDNGTDLPCRHHNGGSRNAINIGESEERGTNMMAAATPVTGHWEPDLQYGPGIVCRLRDRYLTLALRGGATAPEPRRPRRRPSLQRLRKAASMENILDDGPVEEDETIFSEPPPVTTQQQQQRGRSTTSLGSTKRARSVEPLQRALPPGHPPPPRRPQPLLGEAERPPPDMVQRTRMIFERRPEQRTRPPPHTGEVAAKVATYREIIVRAKQQQPTPPVQFRRHLVNGDAVIAPKRPPSSPPPPNKQQDKGKPTPSVENTALADSPEPLKEDKLINEEPVSTPPPDVSRVQCGDYEGGGGSLSSETPDLILVSITGKDVTDDDESIQRDKTPPREVNDGVVSTCKPHSTPPSSLSRVRVPSFPKIVSPTPRVLSPTPRVLSPVPRVLSPPLRSPSPSRTLSPLPRVLSPPPRVPSPTSALICAQTVSPIPVKPKKPVQQQVEPTTMQYDFTKRKGAVPDYIKNDGGRCKSTSLLARIDIVNKVKGGLESGYVLLSDASILLGDDELDGEDEEGRLLDGPPSPCDVQFINDGILIDGRSSLSQQGGKVSRSKHRITFNEGPQVFEYPSEGSLLGGTPLLGGHVLGSYAPKGREEFCPGVTRQQTAPLEPANSIPEPPNKDAEVVQFSQGSNADMLF